MLCNSALKNYTNLKARNSLFHLSFFPLFQNFLTKLEFLLVSSTLSQDLDPDVVKPLWIILWFANLDSRDQLLWARISWNPVPSLTSKRPLWNWVARVLSLFLAILILTRQWELPWELAILTKAKIALLPVITSSLYSFRLKIPRLLSLAKYSVKLA